MISIQQQLSERAIELLALPEDTPCFILDVGYVYDNNLLKAHILCANFQAKTYKTKQIEILFSLIGELIAHKVFCGQ